MKNTSKPKNRPSIRRIVRAQEDLIKDMWSLSEIEDIAEYESICWACEAELKHSKLYRAHIVSQKNGGDNQPNNFVLLCKRCHEEQPDAVSKETLISWIKNHTLEINIQFQRANEATDLLFREAAKYGNPEEVYLKYIESIGGDDAIRFIVKKAMMKNSGLRNADSNFQYSIVDHFNHWAVAHEYQLTHGFNS